MHRMRGYIRRECNRSGEILGRDIFDCRIYLSIYLSIKQTNDDIQYDRDDAMNSGMMCATQIMHTTRDAVGRCIHSKRVYK